ncbi:hypothetical protein JW998_16260 [candidate division KSB1 bacterium]|nr:hypothetical protein [candidate division KSB1 bacterium]
MSQQFKSAAIAFLSFAITILMSCSSTEGQGSGGLEPVISAPQIVDGFMCASVFEDKPVGIDNDFWVDDVVYIWLTWENMSGTREVKIVWVDPRDNLYETKKSYSSKDGKLTTYFWLDTTASATPGEWLAEVYLDGVFVRSYSFWLNSLSMMNL